MRGRYRSRLYLESPDVGAIGPSPLRGAHCPGQSALVSRQTAAYTAVNGLAAGQQRHRRRRTPVVLQRPQHRVQWQDTAARQISVLPAAAAVGLADQIIAPTADCAAHVHPRNRNGADSWPLHSYGFPTTLRKSGSDAGRELENTLIGGVAGTLVATCSVKPTERFVDCHTS